MENCIFNTNETSIFHKGISLYMRQMFQLTEMLREEFKYMFPLGVII